MTYLGIDIAKAKFDVCVLAQDRCQHRSFENHERGFKQVIGWLNKLLVDITDDCHACMEATNSYGFGLAEFLVNQGMKVSIVNPARVKAFANSDLRRNKTDKLDATLIARFCAEKHPQLWSPPTEHEARFQALYRRLETLKHIKSQEQNRLASERCAEVRSSLEAHMAYLDDQLKAVEAALDLIVQDQPELKERVDLLISIPGIGKTTAYFLIAEIAFRLFDHVNQLVAFAGLNPKHNESGTFKGKSSISKMGSARIRKALYFPAISAIHYNPCIIPLAQRLTDKGHCHLSIICASMRKLLHLAFGVIKHNHPFDPDFAARS